MKLKDYERVDCDLLRTPPLDLGALEAQVMAGLLTSWQQGASVDDTLNTLLREKKLLEEVGTPLQDALTLQNQVQLEVLEAEKQKQEEIYNAQATEESQKITETYTNSIEEQKRRLAQAQAAKTTYRAQKTAVENDLEQMRQAVQAKLDKLGGARSLQTLLEIDTALTEGASPSQPLGTKPVALPKIIRAKPLAPERETQAGESAYVPRTFAEKKREQTLVGKVWRVLNYKIW